jgi:cell wall-active antibiotic response 4TMS protein YvqF
MANDEGMVRKNRDVTSWHLALLGGLARQGRWNTRRRTVSVSVVGGADLDLTAAVIPEEGTTLVKVSLVGGVRLTVPAGMDVRVQGFSLIGRRRVEEGEVAPGAPVVNVHAYGIIGGVKVRRTAS